MQEVTNFARFYSILKRVPKMGGEDFAKRELVSIGTDGRTESLREMTRKEYDGLCTFWRSVSLKRETSMWSSAERSAVPA